MEGSHPQHQPLLCYTCEWEEELGYSGRLLRNGRNHRSFQRVPNTSANDCCHDRWALQRARNKCTSLNEEYLKLEYLTPSYSISIRTDEHFFSLKHPGLCSSLAKDHLEKLKQEHLHPFWGVRHFLYSGCVLKEKRKRMDRNTTQPFNLPHTY